MTIGLEWDETCDLKTPITQMLHREPDMGGYVADEPLAHDPGPAGHDHNRPGRGRGRRDLGIDTAEGDALESREGGTADRVVEGEDG